MTYYVHHLNNYIQCFAKRDDALDFIVKQTERQDNTYHFEDFEILDGSDFL